MTLVRKAVIGLIFWGKSIWGTCVSAARNHQDYSTVCTGQVCNVAVVGGVGERSLAMDAKGPEARHAPVGCFVICVVSTVFRVGFIRVRQCVPCCDSLSLAGLLAAFRKEATSETSSRRTRPEEEHPQDARSSPNDSTNYYSTVTARSTGATLILSILAQFHCNMRPLFSPPSPLGIPY